MRAVAALSPLRVVIAAALLVCLVASCDGAYDGNRFTSTDPSPSEQSPAGIYTGFFQSTATLPPETRVSTGVISEDSAVHLVMQPASRNSQFAGIVSVDGEVLTGTLTEYLGARARWFGFDGVRSIDLDGIAAERDVLYGDYFGDDEGVFQLDYGALYERGSSLSQTVGVWSFDLASSGGGVYNVTLDIGPRGELFGADTNGCVFTGAIGTIDSHFNAYSASVVVTSCDPVDGEFTGLAFRDEVASGRNVLHLSFANDLYAFSAVFSQ